MWNKIKATYKNYKKLCLTLGIMAFMALYSVAPALAVLSTEEQAVVDSVTAKVTDYTGMAWTLKLSILGVIVTIGLFSKFFRGGAR